MLDDDCPNEMGQSLSRVTISAIAHVCLVAFLRGVRSSPLLSSDCLAQERHQRPCAGFAFQLVFLVATN